METILLKRYPSKKFFYILAFVVIAIDIEMLRLCIMTILDKKTPDLLGIIPTSPVDVDSAFIYLGICVIVFIISLFSLYKLIFIGLTEKIQFDLKNIYLYYDGRLKKVIKIPKNEVKEIKMREIGGFEIFDEEQFILYLVLQSNKKIRIIQLPPKEANELEQRLRWHLQLIHQ